MPQKESNQLTASFRDSSGFVYRQDGIIHRQVNNSYRAAFDKLINSGLYKELIAKGLLISHKEIKPPKNSSAYKILEPEQIPFISYPYEWCFSQLKDAALVTLKIQQIALAHGMTLKDASAYNIQFLRGRPVLIDTLSFELYEAGRPWIAYRQFCQHFLAPLALMAKVDLRLGTLSQHYIDGVPLDLASRLLPRSSRWSMGLAMHIHWHAKSQEQHADEQKALSAQKPVPINQLLAIVTNLEATVKSLKPVAQKTEWQDYYDHTNYVDAAEEHKKSLIKSWLKELQPSSVWDMGANDGTFGRLAAAKKILTVASDIDPRAVERGYQQTKIDKEEFLLPLIVDMTNPSPGIGWANAERESFLNRCSFDVTLCLALIHHLSISNHLPFTYLAELFAKHTKNLIIEFVPPEDSNAHRLLITREDALLNYKLDAFEAAFKKYFVTKKRQSIKESVRVLYLMERR